MLAAVVATGFVHAARQRVHVDGPPLAHSGGFGEPTCRTCHFDRALNEAGGALTLNGLPERWSTGERISIEVVLRRAQLTRAGFQLSARVADGEAAGRQAGRFRSEDPRVAVLDDSPTGVTYVQHTRAGSRVDAPGEARWRVTWESPAAATAVVFHVAGNASNDDDSEFGDSVYTRRYEVVGVESSRQEGAWKQR